jgi:hypothetical protein
VCLCNELMNPYLHWYRSNGEISIFLQLSTICEIEMIVSLQWEILKLKYIPLKLNWCIDIDFSHIDILLSVATHGHIAEPHGGPTSPPAPICISVLFVNKICNSYLFVFFEICKGKSILFKAKCISCAIYFY